MSNRVTLEIANQRVEGRGFIFQSDYTNVNTKCWCHCSCGYKWKVLPNNIFNGKGCPQCAKATKVTTMINMKGKIIGKLTVLQEAQNVHNKVSWLCRCECGCENVYTGTLLRSGRINSCGSCNDFTGNASANWQGVGELSKTVWSIVINSAKKRKLSFNITPEFAWELFIKQGRRCALSNLPLDIRTHGRTASLDRIDNSKGYTTTNVQWVHKHLNTMKSNHSLEYFIELCKLVATQHEVI